MLALMTRVGVTTVLTSAGGAGGMLARTAMLLSIGSVVGGMGGAAP